MSWATSLPPDTKRIQFIMECDCDPKHQTILDFVDVRDQISVGMDDEEAPMIRNGKRQFACAVGRPYLPTGDGQLWKTDGSAWSFEQLPISTLYLIGDMHTAGMP